MNVLHLLRYEYLIPMCVCCFGVVCRGAVGYVIILLYFQIFLLYPSNEVSMPREIWAVFCQDMKMSLIRIELYCIVVFCYFFLFLCRASCCRLHCSASRVLSFMVTWPHVQLVICSDVQPCNLTKDQANLKVVIIAMMMAKVKDGSQ